MLGAQAVIASELCLLRFTSRMLRDRLAFRSFATAVQGNREWYEALAPMICCRMWQSQMRELLQPILRGKASKKNNANPLELILSCKRQRLAQFNSSVLVRH